MKAVSKAESPLALVPLIRPLCAIRDVFDLKDEPIGCVDSGRRYETAANLPS